MNPKPVFIYYANEPGTFLEYQAILHRLWELGAHRLALRVVADLRIFASATYQELLDLTWSTADTEASTPVNFLAFTNEGIAKQRFRRFDYTTRNLTYEFISLPDLDMFPVTPLSSREALTIALDRVSQLYPPDSHEYHLLVKSHGNHSLAISSLLGQFLGKSLDVLRNSQTCLTSIEALQPALEPDDHMVLGDNGQVVLGSIDTPGRVPDISGVGITKTQFFEIIGSYTEMHFSTVVMESCNSKLDDSTQRTIPRNVASVFTSSGPLPYSTIDYGQLLSPEGSIFGERLRQILGNRFEEQLN